MQSMTFTEYDVYLPSNDTIAKVVLDDLHLLFQGEIFEILMSHDLDLDLSNRQRLNVNMPIECKIY